MNVRKHILLPLAILLGTPVLVVGLFILDAKLKRPHTIRSGSYTGTVVDEATGQPVEGAAVYMAWWWRRSLNLMESLIEWENAGDDIYIGEALTFTDAEGRYRMPDETIQSWIRWRARSPEVRVLIYKKGYVAWNNTRYFDGELPRTPPDVTQRFKKRSASVKLEPWQSGYSHSRHRSFVLHFIAGRENQIDDELRGLVMWENDFPLLP